MRKMVVGLAVFQLATGALADLPIDTIVGDLDNPRGVAVQPSTGHVFLCESGAGRVVRVADGKVTPVVIGFATAEKVEKHKGPLALLFLDKNRLVVGDGGRARVYIVPGAGDKAIQAEKTVDSTKPFQTNGENPSKANLVNGTSTSDAIYISCRYSNRTGCVAKADRGPSLGALQHLLPGLKVERDILPLAVAINPDGHLVVGQLATSAGNARCQVCFHVASSGKRLASFDTDLHEVVSLAYCPTSEQLYALDASEVNPTIGGLYRLEADRTGKVQTVRTKRMASIDSPTAMAFGPTGELFITVSDAMGEGSGARSGKLLTIKAGL